MTLFFDIETKFDPQLKDIYTANIRPPSNYKDSLKITEWLNAKYAEAEMDMALDQDFATIEVICVKEDDNPALIVDVRHLLELINEHDYVTFNGKNFDLPIIIKHCIKNNYQIPGRLLAGIQKYKTYPHKDLMEILALGGNYRSLDTYIQIYLKLEKVPINFATCSFEELTSHCKNDVEVLAKLYKKFEGLFG